MRVQRDHGDQGSPRSPKMKELEVQLALVKTKLKSARKVNKEYKQTYTELDGQFSELEFLLNPKGDEMCEAKTTFEDNEHNLTSRVKDLIAHISNLRHEVDALRANQKDKEEAHTRNEADAQVKSLRNQLDQAEKDLATICGQKSELQVQLQVKTDEVTQIQAQLKRLKDELQIEKDSLLQMSKDIKQETQDLYVHIKSLEEIKNNETKSLQDEKERLHTKISELEELLGEKNNELCTLQKIHKDEENKPSIIRQQVKGLKDELNSLQSENKSLVKEKEKLQLDHKQSQVEAENEIKNLKAKIEDQERMLKEQQNSVKKIEQPIPVKLCSFDSPKAKVVDMTTISQHKLERKIHELANSFNMNMENNIRLLSQRIHVAEETHIDTKDDYKKIKANLELERKELNEKTIAFEAEARKMRDTLMELGTGMLTGMDAQVKKFGESNDNYYQRLSKMVDEVKDIKIWITKKIKELQHDVKTSEVELDGKNKNELRLQEEVRELNEKMSNGTPLTNDVSQLEKKVENLEEQLRLKESLFLELGEEKREAIRQLCFLIDHHRSRYDHRKGATTQMSVRNKRTSEDSIILK